MNPLRIGIVGAGANTLSRHIPGLQALPGVEILGVCNRRPESSERVAKQFGIPRVYSHWQELVDDPDNDAVVIGTWPYLHCPVTLASLKRGKHVLTEARMAMNATEAHAMLEASRARPELVAQVVPSPMTLGVDKTIQRLLAEAYLGELLVVEHHGPSDFLDREAPLHWRQDIDLSGLNIQTMGIFYEAIMRWVGEASSVLARGKIFVKKRRDEDGKLCDVRVPEHVDVVADMHCGAQLHMQQSTVTAHLQGGGTYLFGSEGILRVIDGRLEGARKGDAKLRPIDIPERDRGVWRVEEEFVRSIRGEETVTHTRFEDGVKYMEFTEAVSRSLESGGLVGLPLDLGV